MIDKSHQQYLVHINCLKSFSTRKNNSMVLVFRLALSYLCWPWQFYTEDFLEKEKTRLNQPSY